MYASTDFGASMGAQFDLKLSPPNGEVEGLPTSANQAPWAHAVFPRPRRHYRLSRLPPTIVRRLATQSVRDRDQDRAEQSIVYAERNRP
jgi:hypothetical protein